MRNFFRRKPEKTNSDTQNQQNNPDGNTVSSFGEDHPYFKNGKAISASEILKNEELQKKFPKLAIWLGMYPCVTGTGLYNGCTDLLKIYCFEKTHLDNSYHEFRQLALKNQINEGFNLVLKFERSVNNFKVDVGTAFTDPPFDDLTHLIEAHEYWRQARQQDFAMQIIKFEVNEIVLRKYMDLKQAAVHLVSLLAAIDAVTLNCIPYISFSKLMVSKEVIIQSDALSKQLENLASKYAQQSIQSIQKIDELRARFDFVLNSTPSSANDKNDINQINHEREQLQLQAFKQMLTKQYISPSTNSNSNSYDAQNHCLSISADSSFFFDFVSHPKCLTYPFYKEFEANPCPDTYRRLVSKIIETFSLKGEEATLATYLCSLAFAQLMAPEIFFLPESNQFLAVHPTKNDNEAKPKTEAEKSETNKVNKLDTSSPVSEENNQTISEQVVENSQIANETKEESIPQSQSPNEESNIEVKPSIGEAASEPNPESETKEEVSNEPPGQENPEKDEPSPETVIPEAQQQPNLPSESISKSPESASEINNESLVSHQNESNSIHPTEIASPIPSDTDEATLERMQSVGFDVFIAADPILTLRAISNNMNVEYSTEGSVKYIINCLKMITPKWKEILKFSVDCSIQEYLPPKLRSIRYVINEIVSV